MFISKVMKVYDDNIELVIEKLKTTGPGKIKFIFYDEDIYIDTLSIPVVKKAWIHNIINNKLIYNFDDIGKFSFSYEILTKKENKYLIVLYCINSRKNILYKSLEPKHKVVGVFLIQHCYHYFVKELVKVKDFILVFNSKKYTYVIFSYNGFLKKNIIFKNGEVEIGEILDCINEILSNEDNDGTVKNTPIIMINYEKVDLLMKMLSDCSFRNMGTVDENRIIRKYVGVL
jgi:hypothetical protein